MTTRVLVVYATKYGSTKEVAEVVAATLRKHGLDADVWPAREVHSLGGYSAVVLGAALYMGRWHQNARTFLRRHRTALLRLPVAIFALGPLSTTEKEKQRSRAQLNRVFKTFDWLTPVSVEVFGGVIDPSRLHFPFNHLPKGDARDWSAIRVWATLLVTPFRPARLESSEQVLAR